MKFILQEDKFILSETPQFILNEKFVLTEAQATATQLVSDINKIDTLLPELLTQLSKGIDKTLSTEETILSQIAAINTDCEEVVGLINANPPFKNVLQKVKEKASSTPDAFSEDEIQVLQPLCYDIASNGNSVKDRLKALKNKLSDLTEPITVLKERLPKLKDGIKKLYELVVIPIKTTATIDWKTKFASAVNKETIIEEFIYKTWEAEAAQKVLKIKLALLQECESYGFLTAGPQANPFISFISNVYLQAIYRVSPEKYNVIHNLVAKGFLTGDDLAGKGTMKHGNLVFCKALYGLDPGALKLYIKKQHLLLKAADKPTIFDTNAEMVFNILYQVSTVTTGTATQEAADMQLRPMSAVEQLESKWIGHVSGTDDEQSPHTIATNAELLQQINTTDNAVKVIAALAVKFSSNDALVAKAQSCKEARELMATTTTLEDIRKLVASVERLYKIESITGKQALSLINSILESDQFSLTLG